jgi:CheY-like chemotaxis protein
MNEALLAFLVDDDPDDQKFFRMAVSRLEAPVICRFADSGAEALTMLNDHSTFKPDFIFLDINMPVMNGMECLREMRKLQKLQGTPIYMYSTSADEVITNGCITLGATGVIRKIPSVAGFKTVLSDILLKEKVNS